MITTPKLDISLRSISDRYANRVYLKLPAHHNGLQISEIREAYTLFIIGLASQGVQPLQLEATYETFIWHTQRFFLSAQVYSVEAYILYVIRVVVPMIPRGSASFRLHIFDSSVVVDNILVPKPLTSIYKQGRKSIIARLRGLQGSSDRISGRIERGAGAQGFVKNIVSLEAPILPSHTPGYDQFEYQNVILSGLHLKRIASVLVSRFNQLKQPSLQLPLLRILVRANVIRGTGERAAAAFRRLFKGLPAYSKPSNLAYILTQLSERRLQLTEAQLIAGLQQFYVASRSLGYVIPEKNIPSVFLYTIREYLSAQTSIPTQPFNDKFLEFLYLRLAIIIRQVTVIENQVPIDDFVTQEIFSVFGKRSISVRARRTIIRFIHSSKLLGKSAKGVSVVARYRKLLKSLFKRYPIGTFILSKQELAIVRVDLSKVGIKVDISHLRDANIMAYIGLGLLNRFKASMTVLQVRQLVYKSIRYFLRINKVSNIPSVEFFRILMHQYKVPTPQLPVPKPPVIQTDYTPPPIYILPGIALPVKQVQSLVVILRKRFVFVSIENVQSILAQSILIGRGKGRKIDQNNCYRFLTIYYRGLPKKLAIGAFDIKSLLKKIDDNLVDATISGTGIQSALVELNLHMHSLKMPVPSVQVRDDFLSFILGAYGRKQVRRQLPFGKPFYNFLKEFLPKLRGYLKPFPLFSGPQISSLLHAKLKTPIYVSDIHLYLQVVRRLRKGSLTIYILKKSLSGISLRPKLQPAEMTGLLDYVKEKEIKVTQVEIIRAFAICRLSLGLSKVRISRGQLISIFRQVMLTTVKKHNSLLVARYVEYILAAIKKPRKAIPAICKVDKKFFGC